MGSPSFDALGFQRKIVVGVGGMAVSNDPTAVLWTYSLGSCLGIAAYDPIARAAGMLHAMLPDSSINPERAGKQPGMFVDTGIPSLFRALYELRAEKKRIQLCVAGGAKIMDEKNVFNIGERNYESLYQLLLQHQLKLRAHDLGGLISRTIHLTVDSGEVRLRTSAQPKETLLFKAMHE